MDKQTVAGNLRAERARRGITQDQLSEATGISVATIINYEKGETMMSLDRACLIADVLGCNVSDIAGTK